MSFSLLNLVLLGLLLPSWTSALPNKIQKRSSFKIDRVKNTNFKGHNGPRSLLKTYRKYQMTVSQQLLTAVANQEKEEEPQALSRRWISKSTKPALNPNSKVANYGLVAATPQLGDIEFLSPIIIGGQTINVDFDSGSADLWVFSTQLPAASTKGHQVFDHTKSKTFKLLPDQSFTIKYGDGSTASGIVGTDTVQVGGVTVTNQAIELATSVSSAFVDDVPNSGLLGLAYSKLNQVKPTKQKTFFENLMSDLAEPVWTADLRRNKVGAYEFGRIDTEKFEGENMRWVEANTADGFWQFSTTGYAVGGGSEGGKLKKLSGGEASTIVDTGTTLMLVAVEVAEGYYKEVKGAENKPELGGWVFPCESELPDLWVDVGRGKYLARIRGEDINFTELKGNLCYGGIQPTTSKQQIWGDVFFRSQFVVFHGGNSSLGMAPHA